MPYSFGMIVAGAGMSGSFNNTFANRVLVAVVAIIAACFFLLYRRKSRLDHTD